MVFGKVHLEMLHFLSWGNLALLGIFGQSRVLRALSAESLAERTAFPNQLVFDLVLVLFLGHKPRVLFFESLAFLDFPFSFLLFASCVLKFLVICPLRTIVDQLRITFLNFLVIQGHLLGVRVTI